MRNYTTQPRDSGITHDQFLSLFDDTRHLASPVAACKLGIDDAPVAVATRPRLINLDTTPSQIDNSVEIAALLGDIDAIIAELDNDQPEAQIESTPAATVALAVPDVVEVSEKSVTIDCLMPSIAPAFRGLEPVPAMITNDEGRNILANRREADIVYLHQQGHRAHVDSSLCGGKFKGMLAGDTLDLDLVREFIEHVSSAKERMTDEHIAVNLLFVPECMQVRLCQLATEAIKRKRARVTKEAPATRAKLENSMRQSGDAKNLKHADLWAQLWVCDELITFTRKKRSTQQVGLLVGAMTGTKPMGHSNARVALKAIDARLGVKN